MSDRQCVVAVQLISDTLCGCNIASAIHSLCFLPMLTAEFRLLTWNAKIINMWSTISGLLQLILLVRWIQVELTSIRPKIIPLLNVLYCSKYVYLYFEILFNLILCWLGHDKKCERKSIFQKLNNTWNRCAPKVGSLWLIAHFIQVQGLLS